LRENLVIISLCWPVDGTGQRSADDKGKPAEMQGRKVIRSEHPPDERTPGA